MAVGSFFRVIKLRKIPEIQLILKFHVVHAALLKLCLFLDLVSMKNKALYSYFAWILIYSLEQGAPDSEGRRLDAVTYAMKQAVNH